MPFSPRVWINGKFYDKADAKISVYDHGLLYGDGVFEGIRVYHGKVFRLKEHMSRLYDSARSIWLEIPMGQDELTKAVEETVRVNEKRDGYIRLLVTRGTGSLGLDPRMVEAVFATIVSINGEGTAVLMVEQNAKQALAISHRGFVLELGRNRFEGTGQDLLADPEVRAAYLEGGRH